MRKNTNIKVLLASPKGKISGGISRWTNHVLRYYSSIIEKPCELKHFDISRSAYVSGFFRRLFLAIKDYIRIVKKFKSEIRENRYDILHLTSSASWGLIRDLYFVKIAKRRGIKTIVHFRFGRIPQLYNKNNWEWKLVSMVTQRADRVILIDNSSYLTMKGAGFNNIELLPNPLSENTTSIISEIDTNRHTGCVLFAGHCTRNKGVYELVEACKEIPNINLRLVGIIQNNIKKELVSISDDASWLKIVGDIDYKQVITEMLKCEIFVLPTYTEGFPNVILEAMACGCPIIATPVGAIPEMLDTEGDNPCGICVPVKDVEALHNAIIYLLGNPIEAKTMGENARRRVSEMYLMPIVWEKMVRIWMSLCQ